MAKTLFAEVAQKDFPFFRAAATVLYAKGTVKKDPPAVHFVVECQDGLHSCQAGVQFNLHNRKDKVQLDLIAQFLGASQFHEDFNGKPLRIIAQHTSKGTALRIVIHPTKDMAVVLNGPCKILTVDRALQELKKLGY